MASTIFLFGSRLYRGVATSLLTSWTLIALGFVTVDALNANRGAIDPIASISLFTFLLSRLAVSISNALGHPHTHTITHLVASADRGSRRGALVLFALCWAWLYQLFVKGLLLIGFTLLGAAIATTLYADEFEQWNHVSSYQPSTSQDPSTVALAEIDSFKKHTGFDPTEIFTHIPPRLLLYVVGLMWVNYLGLGLYLLGHTVRSMIRVLSAPTAPAKGDNTTLVAVEISDNQM